MLNDVRWAVRRLTRRVGFSTVFVAILGTTLAITLTIGTVASATIGAALPYEDQDALYVLSEANVEQEIERIESSLASADDWIERGRAFESLGAVRPQVNLTLREPDGVARIAGAVVSRSMFETLRVRPIVGRTFTPQEDAYGAGIPSLLLSYRAWRDRFGEDPEVLDRTLIVNGSAWNVVGVLPRNQSLAPQVADDVDVWLPMGMAGDVDGPAVYTNRLYRVYTLIARRRPDASSVDVDRDLTTVTTGLAADYPEFSEGWKWHAEPLRARVLSGVATPITALFIGGLLLFAVAVVNLLALYIQRIRSEQGELATRLAIGAGSGDLLRLNLVELAILGVVAGIVGAGASAVALPLLPYWLPVDLPAHVDVGFEWHLAFAGLAAAAGSLVSIGLAGMSVALRGLERSAASAGRVVGSSAGASRMSKASLAAQIALSTFLAIGSAIAVRSFAQLRNSDPGIDPRGLTALRVDVPAELRSGAEVQTTADEILRRVGSLPAVERAFLWSPHVPTEATWYTRVRLLDRPDVPDAELPTVRINTVGPGAVTDIGLTIVAGRDLTEVDRESGRRVVLISASAARAWWGSEAAAVGRTIKRWSHEEWSEVVGVVEDAPLAGRQGQGADFFTEVYFLFGQDPQRYLVFLARARPGTTITADALRTAVRAAASDLPPYDIRSMDARLAEQNALVRSSAMLSSLFAATAVVLAALGLYGGLSFVVNQRRREIGVRQALGASPGRVVRELVGGGYPVVIVGTALGAVVAWFGLRSVDATLFVVGARDVPSYVFATAVLLLASLVALLLPSVRALRTTPGDSLRDG